MRTLCALLALGCVAVTTAYKSYSGYQVLSIPITSQEDASEIYSLTWGDHENFDIWKEAQRPGDNIDVMVSPEVVVDFRAALESRDFGYTVTHEDLGVVIKAQREKSATASRHDYTMYHNLAGINAWIDEMAANFSSMVTVITPGQSYEGRSIRAVKMSTGGTDKPAVWIDSCIHAREWIACASNTYQMQKLMEQYGVDPAVTNYLDAIDVYALPVFNVDGYEFSHTDDRMWRKTRSANEGSACIGTDPNRNWDYFHCERGSSSNPCLDNYCGSGPFSEVETDMVSTYVRGIVNLQMYVAMHSYGNWWMSVYAHHIEPPADHAEQMGVCANVVSAIQSVNGEVFDCGTIQSFVGATSGSSVDWTRDVVGVKYNYAPELRGNGFVVPEDEIVASGEECYAGLLELLRAVYEDI